MGNKALNLGIRTELRCLYVKAGLGKKNELLRETHWYSISICYL